MRKGNREEFETGINDIMYEALKINVVNTNSSSLQSLITNPQGHIEKLLVPGGSVIDIRKQKRDFEKFMSTNEYNNLITSITHFKNNVNWVHYLDWIEVRRGAERTISVFLPDVVA